jgi:protein SCO1
MNNSPVWVKVLVLASILILPSVAYLFLQSGTNRFRKLEIFGERTFDEKGDTVFHKIPSFNFTGQDGKPVSDADFKGKIFVANFFFTSCPSVCPRVTSELMRVQKMFAAQRDFRMISHSVDPERDSVEALNQFGKQYLVNPSKWKLVTGKREEIYGLAEKGYLLIVGEDAKQPGGFFHSELLVLVDKEKRIRGYFDGMDPLSVDTLMAEIKVLLTEYKSPE